jgi:hypothetical protein
VSDNYEAPVAPPVPPGTEYVSIFELPHGEHTFHELLERMERNTGIPKVHGLDLVKPGARFVVMAFKDDRRTLGFVSLATEEELLHEVAKLYDRAARQQRTGFRYDHAVTPATLEKLRALEAELPKRYAGGPAVS